MEVLKNRENKNKDRKEMQNHEDTEFKQKESRIT